MNLIMEKCIHTDKLNLKGKSCINDKPKSHMFSMVATALVIILLDAVLIYLFFGAKGQRDVAKADVADLNPKMEDLIVMYITGEKEDTRCKLNPECITLMNTRKDRREELNVRLNKMLS